MAAKSTEIINRVIILIIYRAYYNVITVWCAQSLGIILACILECTNKTLNLPNGVASDPDREFCQILYNSYRVVIQITIDRLPKKFICTLLLCRPKLIVGLPPRLTSFRIISSKSVCSANKISAKKKVFLVQQHTSFKPIWSNAKTPCFALVSDFFLRIPLSVSTSCHRGCQDGYHN